MNIQEYTTQKGEKRFILRGAYIGVDSLTGKKKTANITGRTKKEVKTKLARKKNEFEQNGNRSIKSQRFGDVYALWLSAKRKQVTESTLRTYKPLYEQRIAPSFDNLDISKINTIYIQRFLDNGVEQGWATTYCHRVYVILNNVFKYAVNWGLIPSNPCANVIKPKGKQPKPKEHYLTKEQLDTLLNATKCPVSDYSGYWFYTIIRLLSFTGMRINEALALNWHDVDFKANEITVNKTFAKDEKGHPIINKPKTKNGIRKISIAGDVQTIQILQTHFKNQRKSFLEWGIRSDYVFCSIAGKPPTNEAVYSRLKKVYKSLGFGDVGYNVHTLRHTHASMLFASGAEPKYIQQRLGHASINITLDTYTHLMPETNSNAQSNFIKFMQN